jgi:hypothetical protein
MPTKKVKTNGTVVAIFDNAVIYKRGDCLRLLMRITQSFWYGCYENNLLID